MTPFKKMSLRATIAALAICGLGAAAHADGITRVPIPFPGISIAAAVVVPPGYTTYYISGAGGGVVNPKAPKGSVARLGDTETQTASALKRLKAELAKLGLTFGDVVAAHVYLVGVPSMGGKMDFKGMNNAWSKEFGTKAQPNKPARAAVQVAGLAMPGGLVEIELIAVKKVK
jgi:enamine deaminase RidA (YjgF/YER057c/UK114 family)